MCVAIGAAIFLLALGAAGCGDVCVRNSDCGDGLICGASGSCSAPPPDGAASEGGGSIDGGSGSIDSGAIEGGAIDSGPRSDLAGSDGAGDDAGDAGL